MRQRARAIRTKSPADIESMKHAGRLSFQALRVAEGAIAPGISTYDIDKRVEQFIAESGATPAFKGYQGFPACCCISVNDMVVHGIPSTELVLAAGDIVSVDTGVVADGWVGDNAATFVVGQADERARALCEACEAAMWAGIAQAVVGNHIGDIGYAVEHEAKARGFAVVREYGGHGVGHDMHEAPHVANFGRRHTGPLIEEGLVIAIEPMLVAGSRRVKGIGDGWGVVTADGKPAAHFERTVAVTSHGPVILTDE